MDPPGLSVAGDFMCQKNTGGGRTVSRLDPVHIPDAKMTAWLAPHGKWMGTAGTTLQPSFFSRVEILMCEN